MNPRPPRARALRLPLAAALLATSAPLFAQSITNPSFEANSFTTLPGDIASNSAITSWTGTPATQVGLNPAGGTPYANNGAIPNGANVAFLRAGGTGQATLKGTATGLTIGTKYNVSFRVNARSAGTVNIPRLVFSTNGTGEAMTTDVGRVSASVDATPWRYVAFEFTATATSQELTLTNQRTSGDHTLLVDDFKIAASTNSWSYHAWTNDADSGIDSQYVYTHAQNLDSNTVPTINGVRFYGHEFTSERRLQKTGLDGVHSFAAGQPLITGDSAALALDFVFGGSPSITLQNLKPNTQYKFSVYGVGFDAVSESQQVPRAATFSSNISTDKYTVDLNHYGQNKGIVVDYVYTTDALGSDVTISYPGVGVDGAGATTTFHTSAISNRETTPRTPAATWTTTQWTDDASTGLDSSYVYTHAINLNSNIAANVNGVAFTPLAAGATTATYSNNLAGAVADVSNQVTGFGTDLAKGFLYNAYPEYHKLTGLTPGKQYVVSIFSVGWDANPRLNLFRADKGDGGTLLDQTEFGNDAGIRFDHTYTADPDGVVVITMTPADGASLIHSYAITNREAAQMVGVAPTITLPPAAATLALGDTYLLRVGAAGSTGITYQWKRNGTNIPGATSSSYQINGATAADAGSYTVVVTNTSGTVTTTAVIVDVRELGHGTFNTGTAPDGSLLAGGLIDPHFTIVTNPDSATSTDAFVETALPGAWVLNSQTAQWVGPRANTSAAAGGIYTYRTKLDLTGFTLSSVQITGSWATDNKGLSIRVNDVIVPGQVNDTGVTYGATRAFTINLANTPGLIAGINNVDFYVENETSGLTGLYVDGLKVVGTIPPGTAPHFVTHPASKVAAHDEQLVLSAAVNGSAPITYQWYLNDVALSGQTDVTLFASIDTPAAGGAYKVKATNGTSSVFSNVANITVAPNSNPVATDDDAVTGRNVPLELDILTLLSNDTDAEVDPLDITAVAATSNRGGTVSLSSGIITYTPPAGATGFDTFTYTVTDGVWGGTATGNVYITINANVTAGPPTTAVVLTLSGGTVNGSFTGTANASYVIQRSTDLATWTDLPAVTASGTGATQFSDTPPAGSKAFYRVVYTAP
ncbi:MAG: hypothetical protein JWO82_4468 [Akkermansiaceae bacterium]|nr:hypothetical protein [Akkermansiaceae bacterium]